MKPEELQAIRDRLAYYEGTGIAAIDNMPCADLSALLNHIDELRAVVAEILAAEEGFGKTDRPHMGKARKILGDPP